MSRAQRMFDLVGALAGLVVFAPAMTVIAVAVLIDDGRPVVFRQERVGYKRRPFHILKFRGCAPAGSRGWDGCCAPQASMSCHSSSTFFAAT